MTKANENIQLIRDRIESNMDLVSDVPKNQKKKALALACRRVYEKYTAEQKRKAQK